MFGTCAKDVESQITEKNNGPFAEGGPVCMRCTLSYPSYY